MKRLFNLSVLIALTAVVFLFNATAMAKIIIEPTDPIENCLPIVLPAVISTTPANGAQGVDPATLIIAEFSKSIVLYQPCVIIQDSANNIVNCEIAIMDYNSVKINADLTYSEKYTVYVGLKLPYQIDGTWAYTYAFSFKTKDVGSIRVLSTTPANNATNVDVNSAVTIKYSGKVNHYNGTVSFKDNEGYTFTIPVTFIDSNTIKVQPVLDCGKTYTVTVILTSRDNYTAAPNPYTFKFSTKKIDLPYVTSTTPANNATNVDVNSAVTIKYSGKVNHYNGTVSFKDNEGYTFTIPVTFIDSNTIKVQPGLDYGKTYTVTVTLWDNCTAAPNPYTFKFSTKKIDLPYVTSTTPANNATNVDVNSAVTIKYSGKVNHYNGTVSFKDNEGYTFTIPVTFIDSNTIKVQPVLDCGKTYTVTVTLWDNCTAAPNPYTFKFSTKQNEVLPQIVYTIPADGERKVDIDSDIVIRFSKQINKNDYAVTVKKSNGSTVYSKTTLSDSKTLNVEANLLPDTKYIVNIKYMPQDSKKESDIYSFSFVTGKGEVLPEVESTTPEDEETGVDPDSYIYVTFTRDVDPYDVIIKIKDSDGYLVDTKNKWVADDELRIDADLEEDNEYTVTIKIVDGNGWTVDGTKTYTFSFDTYDTYKNVKFRDVPKSHWAYEAISYLAGKGVLAGFPDGSFRPNESVSREQFAKIMVLALDLPTEYPSKPSFVDIDRRHWAYTYVESAKKYLTGYRVGGEYYFRGTEDAVREDMACALVKAKNYDRYNVDESRLNKIFNDADRISPALRKYVLIAYDKKIITGYTDKTFRPQGTLTRAETAKLIYEASVIK